MNNEALGKALLLLGYQLDFIGALNRIAATIQQTEQEVQAIVDKAACLPIVTASTSSIEWDKIRETVFTEPVNVIGVDRIQEVKAKRNTVKQSFARQRKADQRKRAKGM